jgi:hypothetical protein
MLASAREEVVEADDLVTIVEEALAAPPVTKTLIETPRYKPTRTAFAAMGDRSRRARYDSIP